MIGIEWTNTTGVEWTNTTGVEWAELAIGGAICGGSAEIARSLCMSMTGGAILGGVTPIKKAASVNMSGGVIVSGQSETTKKILTNMSGGALGGGSLVYGISPGQTVGTIVYQFTLTGAADGLEDIVIPISSFQARLRSGASTYLQVVIPDFVTYSSAVAARPNGTMRVDMGCYNNGLYTDHGTIVEANLDGIRFDEGTENKSITIVGYKQKTYISKNIEITDATYKNTTNGKFRIRTAQPSVYLCPGDVVTAGDDTFVADSISYTISARIGGLYSQTEIAEA